MRSRNKRRSRNVGGQSPVAPVVKSSGPTLSNALATQQISEVIVGEEYSSTSCGEYNSDDVVPHLNDVDFIRNQYLTINRPCATTCCSCEVDLMDRPCTCPVYHHDGDKIHWFNYNEMVKCINRSSYSPFNFPKFFTKLRWKVKKVA